MTNQVKAKIFLNNEKGITETDWFRTTNLFNAGKYIGPHRDAFEKLYLLNNETLSAGRSLTCEAEKNSYRLIIPMRGALKYSGTTHGAFTVEPGELLLVPASIGHTYSLINIQPDDAIQFIQMAFKTTDDLSALRPNLRSMHTRSNQNRLIAAIDNREPYPFDFYIGQYEGRVKGKKTWENEGNNVFVYVVQGAIEIEERLLHAGDGLGLWDVRSIEWEALSGYALFVVVSSK